jgi:hypothetical protein
LDGEGAREPFRVQRAAVWSAEHQAVIGEPGTHEQPLGELPLPMFAHRGYVPDWMLDCVYDLADHDPSLRVTVEQVNGPESPQHLRLLCRLQAHLSGRYRPFSTPDFDYISGE